MADLIEYLTSRLSEKLPGAQAQAMMMPSVSDKRRFSLQAKKDAKPGGVMLMLYQKYDEWYFPLIQRPDYDGVHAKQMSFPGGKFDPNDANLTETALRESEEEIGINRKDLVVLGHLTELFITASNFNVLPTIAFFKGDPGFTPDPHEVDAIEEIALAELILPENRKEKQMTIVNGVTINAPYFDLNKKVVWGATAMMLAEFRVIVQPFFQGLGKH